MKTSNKEKLNIEKLKPIKSAYFECKHQEYDEENKCCALCGYEPALKLNANGLIGNAIDLADALETLKMLMYGYGTKKEIKASKKYFNMIPLLYNIKSLIDICYENQAEYVESINNIKKEEKENEQQ